MKKYIVKYLDWFENEIGSEEITADCEQSAVNISTMKAELIGAKLVDIKLRIDLEDNPFEQKTPMQRFKGNIEGALNMCTNEERSWVYQTMIDCMDHYWLEAEKQYYSNILNSKNNCNIED